MLRSARRVLDLVGGGMVVDWIVTLHLTMYTHAHVYTYEDVYMFRGRDAPRTLVVRSVE